MIMPPLALKLKKLSFKSELISLFFIFAFFPYAVFALKLFPNGDCYYSYLETYQYTISSLLNGVIPYWDPMAACGWPSFLSFLPGGILEPFFALSIILGKLFSLNVFQIYMTWIVVRTLPFLIGMHWLLRQHCRHSTIALFGTAFIYYTISISLLRDGILFAIYWPLLLASITFFLNSVKRGRRPYFAFYGTILFLALSLLSGNPAFTCVFMGLIGLCAFLVNIKGAKQFLKELFRRVKILHWVFGLVLLIALLSPAIVIAHNYQKGEYFAYLRVHHVKQSSGRELSQFTQKPLDYLDVSLENSPMRLGRESTTALFPFFYRALWIADGTMYFGFLGVLGILAGLFFSRSKSFLMFFFASLLAAFFMTWSANEFVQLLWSAFPFLRVLNQRALLFPVFIIFASMAGCIGFRALLNYHTLRRIAKSVTYFKVSFVALSLLVVCWMFLFLTSVNQAEIERLKTKETFLLAALFIFLFLSIVSLIRLAFGKPQLYKVYAVFLLMVFLVDANCYYRFLLRGSFHNRDLLAQSRMLRDKIDLKYVAFRSPILPSVYNTGPVVSIVHQLNLRSALPAYWDCDILFSTKRYYELISLVGAEKLKDLLGVASPIVRLYSKSAFLKNGQDAIIALKEIEDVAKKDMVILQEKKANLPHGPQTLVERAFSGPAIAFKYFPLLWPESGGIDQSFHFQLFDRIITIPSLSFMEDSQGIYHNNVFRIKFPKEYQLTFDNTADLAARYYFPELPMALDNNGILNYISLDQNTMMEFIPGKGFLLEVGPGPANFPQKAFVSDKRVFSSTEVTVTSFGPNRIEMQTETREPSILSYQDLFDTNWQATIDGKPSEVLIADHAFKALRLPGGKHRVAFFYSVPYLTASITLYFACVLCFLIIFAGRVIMRKNKE